jgi:assimilatory nitrate reductase catalytic subunit
VLWWACSPGDPVRRLEFAGQGTARPGAAWLRQTFPDLAQADWIEYDDGVAGTYRAALLVEGRLEACLMVSATGTLPARNWLTSLFLQASIEAADRRCILLGQRQGGVDPGPTVCACFGVGSNTIRAAIAAGCCTVDAVGTKLKAGTNCGSCRPEIARLVAATPMEQVA